MRVWDLPVQYLCNKHLVAQHHEIHCIYSIIAKDLKGFSHHPEVERWREHEVVLGAVHDATVEAMLARGMKHQSPYPIRMEGWNSYVGQSVKAERTDTGWQFQLLMPKPWQSISDQIAALVGKGCKCNIDAMIQKEVANGN